MPATTHKCLAGCGRIITWQFAICRECERKYGSSPNQWPEWLSYLWRETQKDRRRNKRHDRYEVTFDAVELMERRITTGKVAHRLAQE